MVAAGVEPLDPYPGYKAPWRSRCTTCGNIGYPCLFSIRQGRGGCRPCGHRKTAAKKRIPEEQAVAEMRAAGMEPLEPYPGVETHWRCRCNVCGTIGAPRLIGIRCGEGGCRPCGLLRAAEKRRIPEASAIANMRRAGMEPLVPYPGVMAAWPSRCQTCNAVGHPTLSAIRSGQGGCIPCSYRYRGENNSKPADEAMAIMRAAGLEPLDAYKNTKTPWKSRCASCGEVVFPSLGNVISGHGCINCTRGGLDFEAPALVYLVTHEKYGAHKVGVTGTDTNRLEIHQSCGWRTIYTLQLQTGAIAYAVEQQVLNHLRRHHGARPFLSPDVMPQRGYTETVSAELITLSELTCLINAKAAMLLEQRA